MLWGSVGGQSSEQKDRPNTANVADTRNHRIQKFDSSGTFLTKWGSLGSAEGQFINPEGVALDSSGNVYVAGANNHRIQKFNSGGTFLAKWGTFGSGDGEFHFPLGVAVDSSENVYVTDAGNNRIQKFGAAIIEVSIDIKPGSDPNCFNNNGNGVIPVAILGSAEFYVAQINTGSVQLDGMSLKMVGKSNKLLSHFDDVNGDGFMDLIVQIQDQDGVFQAGTTVATLTGELVDGTLIQGTDIVCITQ